jgi:hypothetical protein
MAPDTVLLEVEVAVLAAALLTAAVPLPAKVGPWP